MSQLALYMAVYARFYQFVTPRVVVVNERCAGLLQLTVFLTDKD